ncbi:homodimeric dihydroxyacetone kinase [Saccharopolyspora erythraea NRRL 2338]|uniref:Dihydroxyacetone (Glycerone) kinase protein n=2 Tax=Saccharopolyspora erythraea TaxID=1836 RepID=A4FJ08_SACEN|nr:dihydroxyacetone kinase family protein [Saccharopolyspora erythraea]EQD86144.1 dihydroxyacetone kinase [Saccharopolyspora erythraea D]PFG97703.1 homodimeric dihydroxyacetone kinase [Saccharopolyspora erythraea NRRL 2338]QRK87852.1 dihydroxyacetone kinase family protein [Saccharopolyspora erythraea]CAM04033.1 putative dihydroxyacetone (glycerone) kinase protein [Saccharopolyspora erythraea NRRL 2338]
MTRLSNDPARFTEDAMAGFCDLYPQYVRAVDGGVVRSAPGPRGKVAVVIGGGSGHYPAFCGVVGPGFCDGAVVGNIFTSPSAQLAYNVAKAADRGGGVLFGFGNYAGDNMNFGVAQERLRAGGIDCRTVVVTDDVASAPAGEEEKRRGIAGDFAVFKLASAAAEEARSLAEVERVARAANDRTRTLGIAFDGCTLPGQDHKLFTVPAGKMGLGLGIHGEPGVSDVDTASASEVADTLVDGVLAEAPDGAGGRVGVILNGLGATKYEELFVVWARVAERLRAAGLEIVEPEVGELVTSLDMAGVSLTLVWLDRELERYWCAPADTPAYRKGPRPTTAVAPQHVEDGVADSAVQYPQATPESVACASTVVEVLTAVQRAIGEAEDELGRIDAVAADGDHGRGMVKGSTAAVEAAAAACAAGAGARSVLAEAGDAWAARAGGTSGVLWGTGLRAFAECLGDDRTPSRSDIAAGVAAFAEAIQRTGKAEVGDKTMIDAIVPFARSFAAEGSWRRAAAAARQAAEDTASLTPRVGRARPLAERSIGTPDAGAISFALVAETTARAVEASDE